MSKLNYQLQKLQILKEEGKDRLLFNPKCLQDKDKDKRRRVQRLQNRFKRFGRFGFRVTCFPSYLEFSK